MGQRLYVGNLSFHTTEDTLRAEFSAHDEVTDVHVVTDRETGRARGFVDDALATIGRKRTVAMTFNNDVGDSWEWADNPRYPEKYSALGIRVGVNYVIYSLTH